jgi:hypothetical protein
MDQCSLVIGPSAHSVNVMGISSLSAKAKWRPIRETGESSKPLGEIRREPNLESNSRIPFKPLTIGNSSVFDSSHTLANTEINLLAQP